MGQLKSPRIGWQNEHLAAHILSKLGFLSAPVRVGDDVGVDHNCTVFDYKVRKRATPN